MSVCLPSILRARTQWLTGGTSYHSSHINLLSRALNQSIKICIQIESSGFLCVQVMMPVTEGLPVGAHSGILEFKVSINSDAQ